MTKGLKINTALLICVAFIFRLYSLSAGFVNMQSASRVSFVNSKIKFEAGKTTQTSFSELQFSEEDSVDENEHKISNPLVLDLIHSSDEVAIIKQVVAISPSNKHYSGHSYRRHVEFCVYRI